MPQYLRLKTIQDEVLKMDHYLKVLAKTYSPEELNSDPNWKELLQMHSALSKFLPNGTK